MPVIPLALEAAFRLHQLPSARLVGPARLPSFDCRRYVGKYRGGVREPCSNASGLLMARNAGVFDIFRPLTMVDGPNLLAGNTPLPLSLSVSLSDSDITPFDRTCTNSPVVSRLRAHARARGKSREMQNTPFAVLTRSFIAER